MGIVPLGAKKESEHEIQRDFFVWVRYMQMQDDRFALFHATPNAGKRSYGALAYYKAEGLEPGFPDITLELASGPYRALHIETKSETGKLSDEQREWLIDLRTNGSFVCVARSFDDLVAYTRYYLALPPGPLVNKDKKKSTRSSKPLK